jgi:hypothetical protein
LLLIAKEEGGVQRIMFGLKEGRRNKKANKLQNEWFCNIHYLLSTIWVSVNIRRPSCSHLLTYSFDITVCYMTKICQDNQINKEEMVK